MRSDRNNLYKQLRKEYPYFVYESFSYELKDSELQIIFEFSLGDKYTFSPEIKLPLPSNFDTDILADSLIRSIIFNMGMVELLSYWKTACPPAVIIKPMALTDVQLSWWKKLYLNGLGEFFFENGISPDEHFMEMKAVGKENLQKVPFIGNENVLVPVGGGKDSVVTLELLSGIRNCRPFIINPREASIQSALKAGYKDEQIIKLYRSIDPLLLELNAQGFLNGHTPFSAMLAFTSTLVAALHGMGEIALSNESSANEPTIPGTNINHQYSKSLEFEDDFREYLAAYVTDGINYYSLLRPLNELQIAGIFSSFPHHFSTFKSCNAGSKTDSWCGECPKCLFTYIILGPYLGQDELMEIFGKKLLEDERLIPILEQLCGIAEEKPFECIGTIDEVNAAIHDLIQKDNTGDLPALLKHYSREYRMGKIPAPDSNTLLQGFEKHNIPGRDEVKLLKEMIDAI